MARGVTASRGRVLEDLAGTVASIAAAANADADVLATLADTQETYVAAVRALLTGGDIPGSANPGPGGPVAVGFEPAARVVAAMRANVLDGVDAVGARGAARARELDAVTAKEREEKEGPGGGGQTGGGGGTGDGPGDGATTPDAGRPTTTSGPTSPRTPDEGSPPGAASGTEEGFPGGTVPGTQGPPGSAPQPLTPAPPRVPPEVTRRSVTVRRCFEFSIRNTGETPVSDVDLPADIDVTDVAAPQGWSGGAYADGPGLGFRLDPAQGEPIAPRRELGSFAFCTTSGPFSVEARLSHPDGTLTPVLPGQVLVNGRAVPTRQGRTTIPAASREYVHELALQTGSGAQRIEIDARGGTVTRVDGEASGIGFGPLGRGAGAQLFGVGDVRIDGGRSVTVRVTTSSPHTRFAARAVDP